LEQCEQPGGFGLKLVALHFDGDGHLDLAVANNYDGVSVLLGNGDGSFQTARSFPAGRGPDPVAERLNWQTCKAL